MAASRLAGRRGPTLPGLPLVGLSGVPKVVEIDQKGGGRQFAHFFADAMPVGIEDPQGKTRIRRIPLNRRGESRGESLKFWLGGVRPRGKRAELTPVIRLATVLKPVAGGRGTLPAPILHSFQCLCERDCLIVGHAAGLDDVVDGSE
jgi:hypothetical protein